MPATLNKLATLINRAPVPLTSGRSVGGMFTGAGGGGSDRKQALDSLTAVGTLFAIVNRTSNATGSVDWRLWRKPGRDEDRTEVTSHAALDLWNQPNPTISGVQFREATQQHIDLTGEGWWVIARATGRTGQRISSIPMELWQIRPDKVTVAVGRGGVTGYVYHGPGNEKIPLDVDQVIPNLMPNPLDPFRGLGPVQSILTEIDSHRFSMEWNRQFFRNSAQPGGLLETPVTMSDAEYQQTRLRWQEQHQGVSNAHRVAILEGGLKWVDRQMTIRDMQFAELREVSRDVIREAFGFPKSMLGASDDVNRANAEAGNTMFAQWLIVPRLRRIRDALNHRLLPMFGATDLEFDFDDPTPEDAEAERQWWATMSLAANRLIMAGYDPDDVREALELPEMGWVGVPARAGTAGGGGSAEGEPETDGATV